MGRPKKVTVTEEIIEAVNEPVPQNTRLDWLNERKKELHVLYDTLKTEGINRISDLENKISFVNKELKELGS